MREIRDTVASACNDSDGLDKREQTNVSHGAVATQAGCVKVPGPEPSDMREMEVDPFNGVYVNGFSSRYHAARVTETNLRTERGGGVGARPKTTNNLNDRSHSGAPNSSLASKRPNNSNGRSTAVRIAVLQWLMRKAHGC